jgi:hypothetical protein
VSALLVADVPPGVVTVTSTVPDDSAGAIAVIDVLEPTVTLVAAWPVPNATVAPDTKPVPVIVTVVPAESGPPLGLIPVTAGTGSNVNLSAVLVADVPPGVVTVMSTVPLDCGGAVAVIDVAELTVVLAALAVPNATVVAPRTKFVPVIVTDVPPVTGPAFVPIAVSDAGESNMNLSAALAADVPPGVVTRMSTVPADAAGEVAVIDVLELTVTLLAAWPAPNATVVPETNPVPVIVTDVPPAVGPALGLTARTAGVGSNANWSAVLVAEVPPGVVTVRSTVLVPAGAVAVSDVAELTVVVVAETSPKSTVAPETKPVPVIVTEVPPVVGPALGLTAVTAGTGSKVNLSALLVAEVPALVVAVMSTVPLDSAGDVAVIDVAELTVVLAALTVPKVTVVAPVTKLVPVIVTDVAPAVGPAWALMAVTAGTAAAAACTQQHSARRMQAASVSARRSRRGTSLKRAQGIACSPGSSRSSAIIDVPTHR